MKIDNPSEGSLKRYCEECNTTPERLDGDVQLLKQWYNQQPHLPQCFQSDALFKNILIRNKLSMERSKCSLDMLFTMKSAVPEYFFASDHTTLEKGGIAKSIQFQNYLQTFDYVPLPRVTKEGYRVHIMSSSTSDPTHYSFQIASKIFFMIEDLIITKHKALTLGEIYIVDCTNLGIGHIVKLSLAELRKIEVCGLKGYSLRVKGMHFVNCPPYVDVLISMLKSVFSRKLVARMHAHCSLESLHEHVERHVLPEEYGGEERSFRKLTVEWREELENNLGWFLEQEAACKVDESKRPGKMVDTNKLFGIEGSFKTLTVD